MSTARNAPMRANRSRPSPGSASLRHRKSVRVARTPRAARLTASRGRSRTGRRLGYRRPLCDSIFSSMTALAALLASLTLLAGAADTRSQTPVSGGVAAGRAPVVLVARIDTPIHPAAANYLKKVLRAAEQERAALVVVELSTPGGLLTSTREMTSAILRSRVPVVTYVAPSGAQSASAGFFILLAGDVAAMAPGTNAG